MKIISIDNIMGTFVVLVILKFFPYIFTLDFLDPIQNTLEDFQITDIVFSQMLDYQNVPVDSNIVLVNLGNLPRQHIAKLIHFINKYEPKVIGIDSFFRELQDSAADEALVAALEEVKNLVLVTELKNYNERNKYWDTVFYSNKKFLRGASFGYANYIINDDNFRTVRIFSPKQPVKNTEHNSFAVTVTELYAPKAVETIFKRHNEIEIINFRRNIDKYMCIDIKNILNKDFDFDLIRGKIVLIGYMGPDLQSPTTEDIFFTPMNSEFVGKNHPDMYGVVVWANIISMILDGRYFEQIPEWMSLLFTILLIYFNMVFFTLLRFKYENWYEPISIVWTFAQIVIIFLAIFWTFYLLHIELKNAGAFFAIVIAKQSYELWVDSVKPLSLRFLKKRLRRLLR